MYLGLTSKEMNGLELKNVSKNPSLYFKDTVNGYILGNIISVNDANDDDNGKLFLRDG